MFICSPLAPDDPRVVAANMARAQRICRQVAPAGDAPFAPHAFHPPFMSNEAPTEREAGISTGLAWLAFADDLRVYGPIVTAGMAREIAAAERRDIPVRRRA